MMSSSWARNFAPVYCSMERRRAMSSKSRTGWVTSRRIGGFTALMSSRLGFGPMKLLSDMTMASRIGSIGGFVTWANNCLK